VEEKLLEIVQAMMVIQEKQENISIVTCQLKNVVFGDDWIVHLIR